MPFQVAPTLWCPVFLPLQEGSSFTATTPFVEANPHVYLVHTTTAGGLSVAEVLTPAPSLLAVASTAEAVCEIRRFTGLTWEQIGALFGRDPRTAQFWASGRPLRPANQERLWRVFAILLRADCGSPAATLALLLDTTPGTSLKDLMTQQRWGEAEGRVAGRTPAPRPEAPPALSSEQRRARQPIPLVDRIDANQAPLQIADSGPARPRQPRRRVT